MFKCLFPFLIFLIVFPQSNTSEPPDKSLDGKQHFCMEPPEATKKALNLLNSKFSQLNQVNVSLQREAFSSETFNKALDSVGLGRGTITIKSTQRNEHWQIIIGSKTDRDRLGEDQADFETRSKRAVDELKRVTKSLGKDIDSAFHETTKTTPPGPFRHLKHFDFDRHPNYLCLDSHSLRNKYSPRSPDWISYDEFMFMCPEILNQLAQLACIHHTVDIELLHASLDDSEEHSVVTRLAWGLASAVVIGAVSLVASLILKLYLNRQTEDLSGSRSYKRTIAFFISLAIGTLTGDSFLHLIPESLHSQTHNDLIKRLIVIPITIFLLYFLEKFLEMMRARHHEDKSTVQLQSDSDRGSVTPKNASLNVKLGDASRELLQPSRNDNSVFNSKLNGQSNVMFSAADCSILETDKYLSRRTTSSSDEQGIVSEPEIEVIEVEKSSETSPSSRFEKPGTSQNHGHSHSHHNLDSSKSIMVFLGDAFHNLIDGVAIGSAYSSSLLDGLSTSVAVALHEVPHEIGDFVVLVNNGIETNLVFKYAIISNILSLIGVGIGLFIGTSAMDSNYVLCVAAGCFMYVAMINMLPNAFVASTYDRRDRDTLAESLCHLLGLTVGMGIMALIAFHESKISDGLQYIM